MHSGRIRTPISRIKPRLSEETYEGIIKFELTDVSTYPTGIMKESDFVNIADFQWELYAERTESINDGAEYLAVYACCNQFSEGNLWSCDALVRFKLLSSNVKSDKKACHEKSYHSTFNRDSFKYGDEKFIEWNILTTTALGFLKEDTLIIEAYFTLKNIVGFFNPIPVNFLTPEAGITDVVLSIDGNQLHLNRAFLATYSSFFKALFFSSCDGNSQEEIILKAVKFDEFIDLLNIFYPTGKKVDENKQSIKTILTAENVSYLLQLAKRFAIRFVTQECERFLISSNEISIAKKFLYAEQYLLANLQESCLSKLESVGEVKAIKESAEYTQMRDITKSVLLERLLTLL